MSVALAAAAVALIFANYHKLMYATFDREAARAGGVRVGRLDLLLTVLTSVTVVLGMKVVGILMVTALLVIPAAAGLQLAANFRQALAISSATALFSVVAGLAASFVLDLPAGAMIVLLAFVVFAALFAVRRLKG